MHEDLRVQAFAWYARTCPCLVQVGVSQHSLNVGIAVFYAFQCISTTNRPVSVLSTRHPSFLQARRQACFARTELLSSSPNLDRCRKELAIVTYSSYEGSLKSLARMYSPSGDHMPPHWLPKAPSLERKYHRGIQGGAWLLQVAAATLKTASPETWWSATAARSDRPRTLPTTGYGERNIKGLQSL